ncbi:IclR family transcriptional regulator [Parasedimentitalea huanghaiensis]|uniref:Helix-turn-helix domain-containing protein n=1 Tax=Parasedimentitalea huanghaiensis TaxID=2682100 RepID=A0A6L6WJC3_9RHOB|nr:IclR family transcriptional regulator [Zongyanglinia huanghaiensis]MVO17278.1 helix-turn-helix domain-containing protein [Zongyanglinia huanghaiensis]
MKEKQNTLFVGSLAKGLKLLRAFDETTTEMSLTDLARRTGLDKSATQRLANTLHVEGMLDKDPETKRFRPSHAWLELAYAYFWSDPLVRQAMPQLIDLSQRLGSTVNLTELSGDHIIYVSRLPNGISQFSATLVGRRLPALNASAGRVMISTWPVEERDRVVESWPIHQFTPKTTIDRDVIREGIEEAAQKGYATTQNQMILNQTGVAAPIIGPDGRAYAAVQCSVSSHHWGQDRIQEELVPYILDAALAIAPQSRGVY